MGKTYRVRVPAKPVAKGRARFTKAGRAFTPKQTEIGEAWVRMCAVQQVGTPRVPGPLALRVVFVMPVGRSRAKAWRALAEAHYARPTGKPDWDNLAKLTADALNGIGWEDDAAIVSAHVAKVYGAEPATLLAWWRLGEAEARAEAVAALREVEGPPPMPEAALALL
jgi:Holliday junction resolvase RusA-like endonuclease